MQSLCRSTDRRACSAEEEEGEEEEREREEGTHI